MILKRSESIRSGPPINWFGPIPLAPMIQSFNVTFSGSIRPSPLWLPEEFPVWDLPVLRRLLQIVRDSVQSGYRKRRKSMPVRINPCLHGPMYLASPRAGIPLLTTRWSKRMPSGARNLTPMNISLRGMRQRSAHSARKCAASLRPVSIPASAAARFCSMERRNSNRAPAGLLSRNLSKAT